MEILTTEQNDEINTDENDATQSNYYAYSSEMEYNDETGKLKLKNYKIGKYNEIYKDLVGKYVYSLEGEKENSRTLKRWQDNEEKILSKNYLYYITSTNYYSELNESKTYKIFSYKVVRNELSTEKELSKIEDDYGETYYFRGGVKDNYVTFNNMCWKITRIEGDGSVKLVLWNKESVCTNNLGYKIDVGKGNIGYTETSSDGTTQYVYDYLNNKGSTTNAKYILDNWFNTNFTNVKDKLKEDTWCVNYYNNINNTNKVSCTNKILTSYKSYAGFITVDDIELSGNSYTSFLGDYISDTKYWTYSKKVYNDPNSGIVFYKGILDPSSLSYTALTNEYDILPLITLKSNIKITSGNGSLNNAYVIE